jgi:hypothetical protein
MIHLDVCGVNAINTLSLRDHASVLIETSSRAESYPALESIEASRPARHASPVCAEAWERREFASC